MSYALLRMPSSTIKTWDRDMAAKIDRLVATNLPAAPAEAFMLRVLLCVTKIDGNAAKLSLLAGVEPDRWRPLLSLAIRRLVEDSEFNNLFHRLRASL